MELTKSELQIMDVLWGSDEPLSRFDLIQRSCDKTWKDSSVHILLNGLLDKMLIKEAGFVKRSKTYGRTFVPVLTREEYYASAIFSRKNKPDLVGLVKEILHRPGISIEELHRIENIVLEAIHGLKKHITE